MEAIKSNISNLVKKAGRLEVTNRPLEIACDLLRRTVVRLAMTTEPSNRL